MLQFFVFLILAIVVLVLTIVRFKVHPVLALFVAGILTGVAYGYGFVQSATTFVGGFGSTLGGIGCTIIFGSIIAMGIQDSGCVKSLTNFFVKLFKGKNMEHSTGLAAFVMSIPIFGDVTQVLCAPIAAIIGKRKKVTMAAMRTWTCLGSTLTHCLVPPTPGILAMSILLGADVGLVIFWGTIVSLFAYFITWFILRKWVSKEWIDPKPEYVIGIEAAEGNDYHDLLIKEEGLPNVFAAALPILLPVVLIAATSFTNLYLPEGNIVRNFFAAVGERNIAMFIGVLAAVFLALSLKDKVIASPTNVGAKGLGDIILNRWTNRACIIALLPLLITAMGGGFSAIIKAYPNITSLGDMVAQYDFPKFLVPFIIAAVMMIAVGSRTTAGMTAAAIVQPMATGFGFSPVYLTLLVGAGTFIGSHVSDSGFWVSNELFGQTTQQGFKYTTFVQSVTGIIVLILLLIIHATGLI
jgi:GntP family gluconate:H+ symporter